MFERAANHFLIADIDLKRGNRMTKMPQGNSTMRNTVTRNQSLRVRPLLFSLVEMENEITENIFALYIVAVVAEDNNCNKIRKAFNFYFQNTNYGPT